MIRSEKAVSEVIGMVLIIGIMILVIGIIMLAAVPMIESGKERARMDVAMSSFMSMQNDIEEVVRGPIWVKDPIGVTNVSRLGPSRDTEFQLMGGSLSTIPNGIGMTYIASLPPPAPSGNSIMISSGNIIYTAGQESIIYENGAVIRKYESGASLMISDPLITIYNTLDNNSKDTSNITVSIHSINLTGALTSVGGDGKAMIETRPENYTPCIPTSVTPNTKQVNITISTKYPGAWEAFFDAKLNGTAGLPRKRPEPTDDINKTGYYIGENTSTSNLEVKIYGNYNNATNKKDIFLEVYESKINVKVW